MKTSTPDLSHLPRKPGVYLHKNIEDEVIYVGKAKNLKQRVNQYWQKSSHLSSPKTAVLSKESVRVDYIETPGEIDALFLESELIKRYRPKFNIELKDDKSGMYVRIGYKDAIPTVSFVRATKMNGQDDATFVGPFYSASPVYAAMRTLRRALPYSTHQQIPKKACLHYQMGLCPGPETNDFDLKKYRTDLKKLERVLRGERSRIIGSTKKKMEGLAKAQKFEEAARQRNALRALERLGRIHLAEYEIMGVDQALGDLQKLLGLPKLPSHIEGFDISHMGGKNVVASQVVFKNGLATREDYRHYKMSKEQNNDYENMAEVITRRFASKNQDSWGLPDLVLIDGGKGQLSSARLAVDGIPEVAGVAMFGLAKQFEEVIIQKSDPNFNVDLKFANKTNRVARDEGEYYVISFGKRDPVRLLLERIRNEAHRFAVRYHSKLKSSSIKTTELTNIPGVGPGTARKLLIAFGSVAGVRGASRAQIASVTGNVKAGVIVEYFAK